MSIISGQIPIWLTLRIGHNFWKLYSITIYCYSNREGQQKERMDEWANKMTEDNSRIGDQKVMTNSKDASQNFDWYWSAF